jgi:aerobic-type carbon monoxide dehydrogenase small subunit (CoxS/CutS family)
MTATQLAERDQPPGPEEVADHLGGHLCRCTGYRNIRAAVARALGQDPRS